MKPSIPAVALLSAMLALPAAADTHTTAIAGSSSPVTTSMPYLVMTQVVESQGIFPSQGGAGGSMTMGMLHTFAGSFAPYGEPLANGQLLSIANYDALFSVIGTYYGGDGQNNFAVPDLSSRFAMGSGSMPGDTTYPVGASIGRSSLTLTTRELPSHSHSIPFGTGLTSFTGSGFPFDNHQPSLAVTYIIAIAGSYPSTGAGATLPFLGQVVPFAGGFAPSGWAPADGRLLSIQQNQALFSILGTQFGGDGVRTFALPDLRGRVPVGAGNGPGLPQVLVGQAFGAPAATLTLDQLPTHSHGLPTGGATGLTGGGRSFPTWQPALGLTHLIATEGVYPNRDSGAFDDTLPTMGEVVLFAGNFAPKGFATAAGQVLMISQNSALFSLVGTYYGGDGRTTFALPNLQGRAVVGTSPSTLIGDIGGAPNVTLTLAEMPQHVHIYDLPVSSTSSGSSTGSSSSSGSSSGSSTSSSSTSSSSTSSSSTSSSSTGSTSGSSSGGTTTSGSSSTMSSSSGTTGSSSSNGTSSSSGTVSSSGGTGSGTTGSSSGSTSAASATGSSGASGSSSAGSNGTSGSGSGVTTSGSGTSGSGSVGSSTGDSGTLSSGGCGCGAGGDAGAFSSIWLLLGTAGLALRRRPRA